MKRPPFGSWSVPGSADRHPTVLVVASDDADRTLVLEALAGSGHVATGLGDPALARAIVAVMRFDVVLADHELAGQLSDPLLAHIAASRSRLVLIAPAGGASLATIAGVRTIARPLLLQQILGAVGDAIASSLRLAATQLEIPAA